MPDHHQAFAITGLPVPIYSSLRYFCGIILGRRSVMNFCGGFQPVTPASLSVFLPLTPPKYCIYAIVLISMRNFMELVKSRKLIGVREKGVSGCGAI